MREHYRILGISHIGNSRDNQEDNYLVCREGYLPSDVRDNMSTNRRPYFVEEVAEINHFLVAVSDGMGGHACGEVASFLTVEGLSNRYDDIINSVISGEEALAAQISLINNAVFSSSKKDPSRKGMGATLCGVVASECELVGFNVGDSRIYHFSNGSLKQLSTDHTEGQRLINMQLLTEDEAKSFPRRKMLHRYIGCDGEIIPDVFRITDLRHDSVLLLCTDGLSDVLSNLEIEEVLKSSSPLEDKAKRLVDKAVSGNIGHGDNITVIMVVVGQYSE